MIALLLACAGDKDDTAGGEGSWGTITAEREGETAAVEVGTAFGFNSASNGKAALYLLPNTALTCQDVATALDGPEEEDWDRSAILPPETCTVFAYIDYDAAGVEYTAADSQVATVTVSCAMDPGTWEPSEECLGSYCYTGHYWQGNPTTFTLGASGGDGEDYALELDMDGFSGFFTYETMDPAPAGGSVQGGTNVAWCPEMGETQWFSP